MLFGIYLIHDQSLFQQWLSYQRVICRTLFAELYIELALTFGIAPKTFRRYVDDSHARFESRNNATEFLNVLNSQDPRIQYTLQYESDNKELNFLDVTIRNNLNRSYGFVA